MSAPSVEMHFRHSLPTPTGNDESAPDGPELLAPATTGNVRAPVVPEIQASPREVGLLPTSDRSGPLDQDSTVILPGEGATVAK